MRVQHIRRREPPRLAFGSRAHYVKAHAIVRHVCPVEGFDPLQVIDVIVPGSSATYSAN